MDKPVLHSETPQASAGAAIRLDVLNVGANPSRAGLVVSGRPVCDHGQTTINFDGSITFVPAKGFVGQTTVQYSVRDETGAMSVESIAVCVGDGVTGSMRTGRGGKVSVKGEREMQMTFENQSLTSGSSGNVAQVTPCFTPGTKIATPKGEVAVEHLRVGDRVITRDNGIQEIRWAGRRNVDWAALTANPHLRPVMIRKGSLGNGLPEMDMMVSPNHRILVGNDRTALYFDESEVLVAAKHLVGGKGIFDVESIGVTYLHIMFDRHEVVLSDGAWTESFQPTDYTLKGMGNAQRNEIYEVFPELNTKSGLANFAPARRTLKQAEAEMLMR